MFVNVAHRMLHSAPKLCRDELDNAKMFKNQIKANLWMNQEPKTGRCVNRQMGRLTHEQRERERDRCRWMDRKKTGMANRWLTESWTDRMTGTWIDR